MIQVNYLSKTFLIPQEKRLGLKEHFASFFKPTSYEEYQVLKEVTFKVNDGDWLGIIGKNGSGKSTLLKILAGIYPASSGEIKVEGNTVPFLELGVGFEPELSARDNVYLNGLLLGISKKVLEENFEEIIRFAEVEHFVDQKLKNFSSGMKIRLAFAVAMHAPADIFLIDEIFAVGDYSFQKKSLAALKNKLKHKTIIFVSHDLEKVKEICPKVLWLKDGQVEDLGATEEIINKYISANK